jgi:glycosyltransferase WbpL
VPITLILLLLAISFLITFWLTKIAILYALKNGLIDSPGDRTSHQSDIPRGGGISVVFVFLIFVAVLLWTDTFKLVDSSYFSSIIFGGAVVAVLGFWDDHLHVPAKWRLLVQFFAAFVSLVILPEIPSVNFFSMHVNSLLIVFPFYIMLLIWLLNLFNFMDGIDGIASVQAITVSISAGLILVFNGETQMSSLLFVLSATVCGFLIWNWPPARVFMGDACSSFLGFMFGLMAIISSHGDEINLWSWLILLAVFVVDATYTLIQRLLQGEMYYDAHRSHTYQILSRQYNSHKKVTLGVLAINIIWLFPLAYFASIHEYWGPVLSFIALSPLLFIAHRSKAGRLND